MPSAAFETAAAEVKKFKTTPNNDELLKLYGLFKQAKEGDSKNDKPSVFDPRARAKWQHWEDLKGTLPAEAETQYIALVEELKPKYT
ncbi:hypothetical protein DFQ28_001003 [Apophysomyces sp. BC1034]|nr:hypothetical protein DFQ30_001585 [Apophysomyces sp. BC1015]KAG0167009.1 hypothetical protein DFQ29_000692 [Apophysomyces sp. BC1021]KAG0183774.1 hypothetical protein DFQ28_001003 [Apophysomyces sp. BC1034]